MKNISYIVVIIIALWPLTSLQAQWHTDSAKENNPLLPLAALNKASGNITPPMSQLNTRANSDSAPGVSIASKDLTTKVSNSIPLPPSLAEIIAHYAAPFALCSTIRIGEKMYKEWFHVHNATANISGDGKTLAYRGGAPQNLIVLRDLESNATKGIIKMSGTNLYLSGLSYDGSLLLYRDTCLQRNRLVAYNVATKEHTVFAAHDALFSNYNNKALFQIKTMRNGHVLYSVHNTDRSVAVYDWSPQGQTTMVHQTSYPSNVHHWPVHILASEPSSSKNTKKTIVLVPSFPGDIIVVPGQGKSFTLPFSCNQSEICRTASLSSDGRFLFLGYSCKTIIRWDLENKTQSVGQLKAPPSYFLLSANHSQLIVHYCGQDQGIEILDPLSFTCLYTINDQYSTVHGYNEANCFVTFGEKRIDIYRSEPLKDEPRVRNNSFEGQAICDAKITKAVPITEAGQNAQPTLQSPSCCTIL